MGMPLSPAALAASPSMGSGPAEREPPACERRMEEMDLDSDFEKYGYGWVAAAVCVLGFGFAYANCWAAILHVAVYSTLGGWVQAQSA